MPSRVEVEKTFLQIDFALTYCPNGDLLQYISQPEYRCDDVTRFYAAELIEALEHLQKRRIIHRDLKVIFLRPRRFDRRRFFHSA